jgi:hypothetical protein
MKAIRQTDGEDLAWFKTTGRTWWRRLLFGSDWELVSGDERVATLEFETPRRAVAEAADGHWSLNYREKWTGISFIARVEGTNFGEIADYKGTGESLFKLSDGRKFQWNVEGSYGSDYTFSSEDGAELVRFSGYRVVLALEAFPRPEISLLVCFGEFLKMINDNQRRPSF